MLLRPAQLCRRALAALVVLLALKTVLEVVAFLFPGEFDRLAARTETMLPGLEQRHG